MIEKILLVAGPLDPTKSYEYHNFIKPLEKMGITVVSFDFIILLRQMGREAMNRHLLSMVQKEKPALVIFVPYTDQFIPEIVNEINRYTITLGYLFDDMWRIEYSRFWAQHFSYITTSEVNGLSKFKEAGFNNVIYSPFACNQDVYCKKDLPKIYDVTFVGQYHPQREWHISYLKKAGINVRVWGLGWPGGMLNQEEMVGVFNQSRINLNMSNCVSWDIRCLFTLFRPLRSTVRTWRQALHAATHTDMKTVEAVKGRHFEINASGGFQLSYYVEGLERLYTIGDEIALFVSPQDLVEKTRYYLKHEDKRETIANQGRERTLRDHTMEKRFQDMFNNIGIS
jgi:spore maturation protein CgeB